MRKLFTLILLLNAFTWADFAIDINGGAAFSYEKFSMPAPNFYGHLWYKFDQMVFLGVGSGYMQLDEAAYVPVHGSLWLRLPFGGQILPVALGDMGVAFAPELQFTWQASGGLDIKNGDKSSILVLVGHQYHQKTASQLLFRVGLLLEF